MIVNFKINEEIFGRIQDYSMPFPEIIRIHGEKEDGFILPCEYQGKVVTPTALKFGQNDGHSLYFIGSASDIIEYEILKYLLERADLKTAEVQLLLQRKLVSIKKMGSVLNPDYFGLYPPPRYTPRNIVAGFQRVANGIYFVLDQQPDHYLAVCIPICDGFMTNRAREYGRIVDDYIFYNQEEFAIPVFELRTKYSEVDELVLSLDELYSDLLFCAPDYVNEHNAVVEDVNRIPIIRKRNNNYDYIKKIY